MAEILEMPLLSDTMEEGVIAEWHVEKGDTVSSGDVLADVETDKATMEVESYFDGVVLYRGAEPGEGVPVGGLLAIIGKEGEDVQSIIDDFKKKAGNGADKAAKSDEKSEDKSSDKSADASAKKSEASTPSASAKDTADDDDADRLKASPLAKAMAKDAGLDIKKLSGSGEGGRIVKKDVEAAMEQGGSQASSAPAAAPSGGSYDEAKVSQMRKAIARRLSESKFTAPHFYLTMAIDMSATVAFRKQLNEQEGVKVSFNDIVTKAVATALRKHPKVNASWLGDTIRYHHDVHVGIAVAIDDGLIVPVVRNTDRKGIAEIGNEVKALAERARNKELQPEEFSGNTFTISNLGMYGIEEFTAIINPPDACILAVGAISDVPVVKNGAIVPGKRMKVTLSCDHRVVDGATGSEFLQTLQTLLENPLRMLL